MIGINYWTEQIAAELEIKFFSEIKTFIGDQPPKWLVEKISAALDGVDRRQLICKYDDLLDAIKHHIRHWWFTRA